MPDESPEGHFSRDDEAFQEQSCLRKGTCEAELTDRKVGHGTGFEHGDADQTKDHHVYEELLVKGFGRVAMPGGGAEGMLEISIKRLDIPAHVIETGQF